VTTGEEVTWTKQMDGQPVRITGNRSMGMLGGGTFAVTLAWPTYGVECPRSRSSRTSRSCRGAIPWWRKGPLLLPPCFPARSETNQRGGGQL
jgi:hypothetical protein